MTKATMKPREHLWRTMFGKKMVTLFWWNNTGDMSKNHTKKHIPYMSGRPLKPGRHLGMIHVREGSGSSKKKVHSFEKYTETRQEENYATYARAGNQARWSCRNAVRDFERTLVKKSKNNPNTFCKYANSKLKTNASILDIEKQVLNGFFSSVFTRENLYDIPNFPPRHV